MHAMHTTTSMSSSSTRMFVPQLQDYDISPTTGFAPDVAPLARLPHPAYEPWERILDNLRSYLLMDKIRPIIEQLPVIPTSHLGDSPPAWRRANLVLSMLTSAYVWGRHRTAGPAAARDPVAVTSENDGDDSPVLRVIPPCLSIPLTETAKVLGLRPIICYATSGLWNWFPLDPTKPFELTNIGTLQTFSGTMDESWFYLIPVGIEFAGAPGLPAMVDGWQAIVDKQPAKLQSALTAMLPVLDKMTSILHFMHARCDPHIFYHQVRPYVAGWALVDGGVRYEDVDAQDLPDSWFLAHGAPVETTHLPRNERTATFYFAGGSAGQSSLIQAFDVFLGVSHHPTGKGPVAAALKPGEVPANTNFITEMREYMPKGHRDFLNDAQAKAPNVREYVAANAEQHPELALAYNQVVEAVKKFRDVHLAIVARYIIMQARKRPGEPVGYGSSNTATGTLPAGMPPAIARTMTVPPALAASVHPPVSVVNGNSNGHTIANANKRTHDTANGADDDAHESNKRARVMASRSESPVAPDMIRSTQSSPPLLADSNGRSASPAVSEAKFARSKLTETANGSADPADAGVRGTGGTQLMPFLKQARDETRAAAVPVHTKTGEAM
ncbi:Indoleamine 2,3-dioxygenase-domain-containing protein [Catenaria anguillulae PL171]|uniref:Indoleamine 2,3-dioxygenase-domain-containing protein n=1 Tax=Catenaria anguillulae PL171 TaxID=765915 RepID=A0A1Y2H572_9FUNG|nr:Indoleamine 2,3-dioxygenase-domain-containing protein [Catenaria anguillulae PL171]